MSRVKVQKEIDPEQHPDFIKLKAESETYARAAANATVERMELIDLTTKNQNLEGKFQDLESIFIELKKFQNEGQESRRKNRLIKQILAVKYSPEFPKNVDTSVWLIEHKRLMETDLDYKKDYELCEKAESIEGFTKGEEFQKALENGDRENKKKEKELANIINKLTRKNS
jgi:hypothetical protein